MEFANRKACIEHYQEQFPNLPRYMVELALDYDLATGAATNEKPLTGKQKRKQKQAKKKQEPVKRELNEKIKEALKSGKRLEVDSVKVVKAEDYKMPPFLPGHIDIDGAEVAQGPKIEEIDDDGVLALDDDF